MARGQADGAEEGVLAVALEQAELKQHRDESERGENEKETHTEEEPAEIDGGFGGVLRARADVAQEELIHLGPERAEERALEFVRGLRRRMGQAEGGEVPQRVAHISRPAAREKNALGAPR